MYEHKKRHSPFRRKELKLEVGTEVVINDKAPINRYATVVFVPPMMNQLGKRGTIIQSDEKHNSTYVYQIRTEDGENLVAYARMVPRSICLYRVLTIRHGFTNMTRKM